MSHTSSSHFDWGAQVYQQELRSGTVPSGAIPVAESTVITATTSMAAATGAAVVAQPAGERRTGRVARRRSRPSRRAPTTILNTDAANFRAMVQQFTGVPAEPFTPDYPLMPETRLSYNGYITDPNMINQQAGNYPLSAQHQQYEQFHQRYDSGYQQEPYPAAQIERIGSGGFIAPMIRKQRE